MNISAIEQAFADNFTQRGEYGAALSIWENGHEVLQLCGGEAKPKTAWDANTLVPIYSATKVVSAACFLLALQQCQCSIDMEIGELWPRFPLPHASMAQLLSHQVGLAALARPASIFDLDNCRAAIEESTPAWQPPQHGYHPHTFGPILDILMQELWGGRICDYWEEEIRATLDLDLYLGIPSQEAWRVAELRAPRIQQGIPQTAFYQAYFTPGSLQERAFSSITGIASARQMNEIKSLQCGCPAKGGIASARGLAKFYNALQGWQDGSPFTSILPLLQGIQSSGWDQTLLQQSAFSCGAMCEPKELFHGGFGHAGAGGSHAFCIPARGLSFAYVMNQMEFGVLPGAKVEALLAALNKA